MLKEISKNHKSILHLYQDMSKKVQIVFVQLKLMVEK